MDLAPDPDWYFEHVLLDAEPGRFDRPAQNPIERWRTWWEDRWTQAGGDPAARLARRQGFVLTTAQQRYVGWARHDLRREVRRGQWSIPARGVASPVVGDDPTDAFVAARRRHALAATGVSLLRRGQVISARSAAILRGLPTIAVPPAPELTVPAPATLGRRGSAHLYSAALTLDDVTSWYGAPVTRVARTIVDLARHDRRDGLMAADAALRAELTSAGELDAALESARGWPGVSVAREVLALADPRAESPLESMVRLALHDSGFPAPELQVTFDDAQLGRSYRVDLFLRKQRLIIEADGRVKYTDDALWREKRREARLRAITGNHIERVTWSDVLRDWPDTERRLWLAGR